MRSLLKYVAGTGLALALAGCFNDSSQSQGDAPGDQPFAGASIVLSVPEGLEFPAAWEGPLAEWGTQTGAQVQLAEHSALDSLAAPLATGEVTWGFFPLQATGELIAERSLAPIPDSIARDPQKLNWGDLLPGLRETMPSRNRQPLLLPVNCPVLVCCFRQDLLERAGLAAPATWEDYDKLVETLDKWAPGLHAAEPCQPAFLATLFLARAVSYAKHPEQYSLYFDIDSGAPLIDGPGFVRALESAVATWRRMPEAVRRLSPDDCRQRLQTGQAALALIVEPATAASDSADSRESAGDEMAAAMSVGFCRLPGARAVYDPSKKTWEAARDRGVNQVTLCGFAGWAAGAAGAAKPTEVEGAWSAFRRLAGDSYSGIPPRVAGPCRESQAGEINLVEGSGWNGREATVCLEAVAASLRDRRLVWELPVPGRTAFLEALSRGIGRALDEGAPADQALQQVAAEWRQIAQSLGTEKVRDAYRQSLGLGPAGKPR
ncbi:MAG: hypothetical protein ACT4QC_11215 [Planctomycetaceae bacterium]